MTLRSNCDRFKCSHIAGRISVLFCRRCWRSSETLRTAIKWRCNNAPSVGVSVTVCIQRLNTRCWNVEKRKYGEKIDKKGGNPCKDWFKIYSSMGNDATQCQQQSMRFNVYIFCVPVRLCCCIVNVILFTENIGFAFFPRFNFLFAV